MTMKEQAQKLSQHTETIVPQGGLLKKLDQAQKGKRPLVVKLGLDPTAPDMHLGHTVVLRKLRQFQDCGHVVVLIIGDFTSKIGDPSGKSKTRPLLTDEDIKINAATYFAQATKVLDKNPKKLKVRFNGEWLGDLAPDDFIKLFTKVTAQQILARDDFQKRLAAGTPIGFHELMYPVLQGYDSVIVEADVEIGGTDQTFNLLMGRDVQQEFDLEPQVVLTMPLIPGTDGKKKMSKSLGNYIGITEKPNEMYGKVMSVPDALLQQYAELCTDLEWKNLKTLKPMEAKKRLSHEIVKIYHSENAADKAEKNFKNVFQDKLPALAEFPTMAVSPNSTLLDFLTVEKTETGKPIFPSRSEARRKILEGAVEINDEKVIDPFHKIILQDSFPNRIRIGKNRFYRLTRQ